MEKNNLKMKALRQDELPQALAILENGDYQQQIFNQEISKEAVRQLFCQSFEYEDSDLMGLFSKEELVAVWILFHDDPSEFATITYGVFTINDYCKNLSIVLDWLQQNYGHYRIILGIRTTNQLADKILSHQAKLLMTADIYKWSLEETQLSPAINPLTKNQFLNLRTWYDKTFAGVYWQSEKILEEYENWVILADVTSEDSTPQNFVGAWCHPKKKSAEIFTSELKIPALDLFLTATKFFCQQKEAHELYWMVDEKDPEASCLKAAGNVPKGTYKEFQLD